MYLNRSAIFTLFFLSFVVSTASAQTSTQTTFLHSGEWGLTAFDLVIKGRGFDYVFARKYESQGLYSGPLGQNWDHQYFMRLMELPNGDVFFYDGMGRKEIFKALPPAGGTLIYASPPGQFAELKKQSDGKWLIHQPDSMAYFFNNYGQLESIQDRNGNKMEFFYSPTGQLTTVVDTLGRAISYHYNDKDKLVKVQDFAGREIKFSYDEGVSSPDPQKSYGLLSSVTGPAITGTSNGNDFPNGKTTKYKYQLGQELHLIANLIEVTNPRGEVYIVNKYNTEDELIEQLYGGAKITFQYLEGKTTVTDRRGIETVYEFNGAGNPTAITRAGLTTRMEYDPDIITPDLPIIPSDGLLTKITYPEGNSIEYNYEKSILSRLLRRRSEPNVISIKRIPGPRGSGGSDETLITKFTYDLLHNQVLTSTDAKGNITTYERDQQGNAKRIIMPEGVVQSFEYNKYGQVTTEISGEGKTTAYEYYGEANPFGTRSNPDDQTGGYLKTRTVGGAYSNTFVWDDLGRMKEFIDGNGVKSKYEVNSLDQVIRETRFEPLNYETINKYDLNNNLVNKLVQHSSAGGDGFTEYRYEYNHPLNYLTKESQEVSDGKFAHTSYQYDENGNRELITDPEGNQTKYVYDNRDLNVEITQGFGSAVASTSKTTYDGNGNILTQIDGEGNKSTIIYDGYNRQIESIDALANRNVYTYDNNGNVATETLKDAEDVLLSQTASQYDGINRLKARTQEFEPQAAVTTYNYDKESRISSVVDARNNALSYTYDGAGRLETVLDAAGNKTTYKYDGNSNTVEVTQEDRGPLGVETYKTINEFDQANRLTKSTDPAGEVIQNVYDSVGNLVISIDPEGNQTSAEFDNANRRVKTEEGNGTIVTRFEFDLNSRLTGITDANGNTTRHGYDQLNRNNRITYADGMEMIFSHDNASNVKTVTDPNGTIVTNNYDELNRLSTRSIQKAAGVEGPSSQTFEYDGASRLKKASDDDSVVALTYDFLSNIKTETQNGKVVSSKYDSVGNRTEITYPSGRNLVLAYSPINLLEKVEEGGSPIVNYSYQGPFRTAVSAFGNGTRADFAYDSDQRVTSIQHTNQENQVFAGFSYGWNKADQRKFEQKSHENNQTDVYSYDSIYRITQLAINSPDPSSPALAQKTLSYVQDGVHNFKQLTESERGITRTKSTHINSRNQYTTFDGQPLSYDSNGNTKGTLGQQLFYDYANQLTRVINSDTTTTTMTYDALGRRTSKTVNGQTINYVSSGQQTLEEYAGAALQNSFVYGRDIDEVVQTKQGGQRYYYHLNSIGSVKMISDSSGKMVEQYEHDAYGNQIIRADHTAPEVEQLRLKSGDLHIRFTETIQRNSLNITLKDNSDQSVSFNTIFEEQDRTILLKPTASLSQATQYTLRIAAGVKDLMLNSMASDFQKAFTVAGDEIYFDNKSPEVDELTIANGRHIKVTFSEEISEFPDSAIAVEFNNQPLAGSLSFVSSSKEAQFSLNELAAQGSYTIRITSAVRDESDRTLPDFEKNLVISSSDQLIYRLEKDVIDSSSIGNTVTFQGRNQDPSTALIFFRARYLNPLLGRFISPDPVGYIDSPNLYQAFYNNPANAVDPLGLDWFYVTNVKNQPDQWEWHKGSSYSYADKTGRVKTAKGYKHLLVAKHVENDIVTGAKIYQLDIYNQDMKHLSGRAFSGGELLYGFTAIRTGNYTIRADLEKDTTGPTAINPDSDLCNPYPSYGLQVVPDRFLPLGPTSKPTTCTAGNPYPAYGPKRARLNPWEGKDEGYYLHGQIPTRANTPGGTHGCLCYGTDTRIIDYIWTLNEKVPVAVNVPVKQPSPKKP